MFYVLDHADVVYTGELSQATLYVVEHYGVKLDEAMRSGIKIACTDSLHRTNESTRARFGSGIPDFWKPHEEWTLD